MNPNTPASPGNEIEKQARTMGLGALAGIAVVVVAVLAAFAGVTMSQAHEHERELKKEVDEASTAAEIHAAIKAALDEYNPNLNTAGDHVYSTAYVNDGTGVVTTPLDAGVFTVLKTAPFVCAEDDGSAGIACDATTGLFTVAKAGVGELELMACFADFASSSNVAGTTTIKWEKNGAAITGVPVITKVEPVDAGNGRSSIGCTGPFVVDAALADTFGVYLANAGGGITGTTRSAGFRIIKVLNK